MEVAKAYQSNFLDCSVHVRCLKICTPEVYSLCTSSNRSFEYHVPCTGGKISVRITLINNSNSSDIFLKAMLVLRITEKYTVEWHSVINLLNNYPQVNEHKDIHM